MKPGLRGSSCSWIVLFFDSGREACARTYEPWILTSTRLLPPYPVRCTVLASMHARCFHDEYLKQNRSLPQSDSRLKTRDSKMEEDLSKLSRWTMRVIISLMGLLVCVVVVWQGQVLGGKRMENPDGSADDWHEQRTHYGIAFADIVVLVPTTLTAFYCYFVWNKEAFAHYLFSLLAYWFIYTNLFCTTTSLRFESPSITFEWFIVFPFGILVGIAYLVWAMLHFDVIFRSRTGYTVIPDTIHA